MEIDIRDLGARTTDILQTEIIQKAIDDCFLTGGGTVKIPESRRFRGFFILTG